MTLKRALGFAYFRLICLMHSRNPVRVARFWFRDEPSNWRWTDNPYVEILEEGFA